MTTRYKCRFGFGISAALFGLSILSIPPAWAADPVQAAGISVPVTASSIDLPSETVVGSGRDYIDPRDTDSPRRFTQQPLLQTGSAAAVRWFDILKSGAAGSIDQALGNIFAVRNISIDGEYYRTEPEILAAIGIKDISALSEHGSGVPLTTLARLGAIERLKHDPWFSSVHTNWTLFPLALSIVVSEEQPWIVAEYSGEPWLISRTGSPLQPTRTIVQSELAMLTSTLPRLDGIDPPVGSDSNLASASSRLAYATKLLRLIASSGELPFAAERFTLDPDGNLLIQPVDFANQPVILFGPVNFNGLVARLKELSTVAADLKKRGEHPKKIDLRFKDQIIVE